MLSAELAIAGPASTLRKQGLLLPGTEGRGRRAVMDEIAARRADKLCDSREWSFADALEQTQKDLADKDKEQIRMAIHWWEMNADGIREHHYCCAGLTVPEHITLLELAKWRILEWWKK